MFPYLARERKLTRIGIVHDVNEYGRLFLERLTALAATSGYTVAGNLPLDSREPGDVAAGLERLVNAGATAIVMALYPAQARRVVEAKGALAGRGTLVSVGRSPTSSTSTCPATTPTARSGSATTPIRTPAPSRAWSRIGPR